MLNENENPAEVMVRIKERLGDQIDEFLIPPPVFTAMHGEFLMFDPDMGVLKARFPVLESYLNPYGAMQGGMVAAAIDNTLGPLSMLVAPPNVTRRLELTYSRPVTPDMEFVVVVATLLERDGQQLNFKAEVFDGEGIRLVRAKAMHWIVDGIG
jgi:acyl-coenzyme A thioesterase PaaI-like protein